MVPFNSPYYASISLKIKLALGLTLFGAALICNPVHSKALSFETTRLKSTGGAGVASALVNEATVLNPAPMAFFKVSSIYLQKGSADVTQTAPGESFSGEQPDDLAVIATDTKGDVSGSLGYLKTSSGYSKRNQFVAAIAKAAGKSSSIGFSTKFTKDELSDDGVNITKESRKQFNMGIAHALSPSFTLGLVAIDPLGEVEQERRTLIGAQYVFRDMVSVMADLGADQNNNLSDTLLYRAALQLKVYNDFFLRVGTFNDKGLGEKGNGVGLGWVGPKLVFEAALKNTTINEDLAKQRAGQEIKETSFALSYHW